jgi:pyridoxine kinase
MALRILHVVHQVPHVVISSIPLSKFLESDLRMGGLVPPLMTNEGLDRSHEVYSSDRLLCLVSSVLLSQPSTEGPLSSVHIAVFPRIKGYFSGVGDLFSALVLGHFVPSSERAPSTPCPSRVANPEEIGASSSCLTLAEEGCADAASVCTATALALATTQAVLLATNGYCESLPAEECPPTDDEKDGAEPERRVRRMRARELRIVQSLGAILTPPKTMRMEVWDSFWTEI